MRSPADTILSSSLSIYTTLSLSLSLILQLPMTRPYSISPFTNLLGLKLCSGQCTANGSYTKDSPASVGVPQSPDHSLEGFHPQNLAHILVYTVLTWHLHKLYSPPGSESLFWPFSIPPSPPSCSSVSVQAQTSAQSHNRSHHYPCTRCPHTALRCLKHTLIRMHLSST